MLAPATELEQRDARREGLSLSNGNMGDIAAQGPGGPSQGAVSAHRQGVVSAQNGRALFQPKGKALFQPWEYCLDAAKIHLIYFQAAHKQALSKYDGPTAMRSLVVVCRNCKCRQVAVI